MERVSKAQPALLAYVMASSEELGEAAQELALYMFVVIHKAFEKQFGVKLQNAGMKQVEEQHDLNEQVLASLIGHEEEDLVDTAIAHAEIQPVVYRYIIESIMEPDEDTELSEFDQGALALTMKTVLDVLDGSVRSE